MWKNVEKYVFLTFFSLLFLLFPTTFLLVNQLEVLLLKHEVCTQVFFFHNAVGGEFLRAALEQDSSLEEQIRTVGNIQCFVHIMVGYARQRAISVLRRSPPDS